jgi:hypothetical protein
MPVPTLSSATTILSGRYSFMQVGIGGTHDDAWPGSGEAHPIAGVTHMTGFHTRATDMPMTATKTPAKRRSIAAV